mmetsp:Transcript_14009/g.33978  ORF Transcript_14009/g.33978 Transcript_14009/m.33978 type:complete len:418 (+) Transcript_14009:10-1263(+)
MSGIPSRAWPLPPPSPAIPNPDEDPVALATAIKELRSSMADDLWEPRYSDAMLARFLRARALSVPAAQKMLEAHLDWREEARVEELVASFEFPELDDVLKAFPYGHFGTDDEGNPIVIKCIGQLDPEALLAATSTDRLINHFITVLEATWSRRLPACSIKMGRPVHRVVTIVDARDLSYNLVFHKGVQEFVKRLVGIMQNHYPSLLKSGFVINAPWLMRTCWGMVRPLLNPNTQKKVSIWGEGDPGLLPALREAGIDPDQLPGHLFGRTPASGPVLGPERGPWVEPGIVEEVERYHVILRRLREEAEQPWRRQSSRAQRTTQKPTSKPFWPMWLLLCLAVCLVVAPLGQSLAQWVFAIAATAVGAAAWGLWPVAAAEEVPEAVEAVPPRRARRKSSTPKVERLWAMGCCGGRVKTVE